MVGKPTFSQFDEAGLCGWTDPDNRRAYPWGHEDMDLIDYHKAIIRIHKEYQVIKTGSIMFLLGEYNFCIVPLFTKYICISSEYPSRFVINSLAILVW